MGQLRRQLRGIGRWLVGQWRNNPLGSLLAIATLITLTYIYIETARHGRTGFAKQTLWDWMDLLLVPLALVIGGSLLGVILTHSVENRQRRDDLTVTIYNQYLDRYFDLANVVRLLQHARIYEGLEERDESDPKLGQEKLSPEQRNYIRIFGNWLDLVATLNNRHMINGQLMADWRLDNTLYWFYDQTEGLSFLAEARKSSWLHLRHYCERRQVNEQ